MTFCDVSSQSQALIRPRNRSGDPLIIGLGLVGVSVAIAVGFNRSPISSGVSLTIITTVLASGVLRHERSRAGVAGTASPLSLYFLFWLGFVFIAGLGGFALATADPLLLQGGDSIVKAYDAALLSLLLVASGYYTVTRRSTLSEGLPRDDTVRLSKRVLLAMLAVGWSARIVRFQQGRFGYLGYGAALPTGLVSRGLQLTDGLLPIALVAIGMELLRPQDPLSARSYRRLLTTNVLGLAVTAMASGVKGQLLTDLLPLGILYLFCRGRPPVKTLFLLMLLIVVEYSGVQTFRSDLAGNEIAAADRHGVIPAAQTVFDNIVGSWATTSPGQHLQQAWKGVSTEYAGTVRNLAIILQDTPSPAPYLGSTRLVTSAMVFLPSHSLTSGSGTDIGSYVNTTYLHGGPHSSAPPTQPGDFFISGGWPVLIFGELCVGILLGMTWRIVSRAKTRRVVVFYAVAAGAFANAGLDWETLVRTLLQDGFVYGPLMLLLFARVAVGRTPGEALARPRTTDTASV